MTGASYLAATMLAGALLGTLFYAGLWLTVRTLAAGKRARFWLAGGFLLRALLAIAGIAIASQGEWRSLIACLAGFCVARACAVRLAVSSLGQDDGRCPGRRP